MTRKVTKCYLVVALIALLFLVYIGYHFDTYITTTQTVYKAKEYTGFTVTEKTNSTIILENTLPVHSLEDVYIGFLTYHQEVFVYVMDKKIYEMKQGNNVFGSTTGQVWNFVNLNRKYEKKQIRIIVHSPYGEPEQPTFYMGGKLPLYLMILEDNILSYSISILMLLFGLIMIGYWCYVRYRTYIRGGLFFLGTFALLLGIWSLNEVPINILVFQNHVVSSYLAFIVLSLLPLPFLMFVKDLYSDYNNPWWYVLAYISMTDTILIIALQYFDILDVKRTLVFTHFVFAIFIIVLVVFTVREMRKGSLGVKVKANIVCIMLDLIAIILDMLNYYMKWNNDSNVFSRISFFIHIVVVGWVAMKESISLIKMGKKAEVYEKMAYRDALTELLNRTAFEKDIIMYEEKKDDTYIAILDLNDLKKYNDTLGHDAGDRYIKTASEMIHRIFGSIGTCYRIGGDEFCVVSATATDGRMKLLTKELLEEEERYNKMNPTAEIGIAFGYAKFDWKQDATLDDTRKRADELMYQREKEMKNSL